jgi:hypothetical protein
MAAIRLGEFHFSEFSQAIPGEDRVDADELLCCLKILGVVRSPTADKNFYAAIMTEEQYRGTCMPSGADQGPARTQAPSDDGPAVDKMDADPAKPVRVAEVKPGAYGVLVDHAIAVVCSYRNEFHISAFEFDMGGVATLARRLIDDLLALGVVRRTEGECYVVDRDMLELNPSEIRRRVETVLGDTTLADACRGTVDGRTVDAVFVRTHKGREVSRLTVAGAGDLAREIEAVGVRLAGLGKGGAS